MKGAAILRLARRLCILACVALVVRADDVPHPIAHRHRARVAARAAARAAAMPPAPASAPAQAEAAPEPAPAPEPLYTLDVQRQDAETVLWEFARRAGKNLDLLDRPATLITVYFANLPFEKGLKEILRAADLDFVKSEDGYTVGLPIDLKLRFPKPEDADKDIEATYRCRRIDAASLAAAIKVVFPEEGFRVNAGPQFLTPEMEGSGGGVEDSLKVLKAGDAVLRTHDVVFSGKPEMVLRALTLARKFDHPRKQVRVNIRVVQMTSNASRNLGVAWMPSLSLTANEQGSSNYTGEGNASSATAPQGNSGISLGKFTHSVVSVNATLNAMEQAGDSKTLANPTLLVLDGEKSFILSGTKYVLPQIDSRDASGQSLYSTTTIKVGLYLQVGVQVGLDDDMVLSIYPQVTSLNGYTTIDRVNYPIINTIEEQVTVRAVKGDVIALGGIKSDAISDSKTGVPFLAKLPLFGSLFSSDAKTKNTQELMFFLTPELVEDAEQPLRMELSVAPGAVAPPHSKLVGPGEAP